MIFLGQCAYWHAYMIMGYVNDHNLAIMMRHMPRVEGGRERERECVCVSVRERGAGGGGGGGRERACWPRRRTCDLLMNSSISM